MAVRVEGVYMSNGCWADKINLRFTGAHKVGAISDLQCRYYLHLAHSARAGEIKLKHRSLFSLRVQIRAIKIQDIGYYRRCIRQSSERRDHLG